MTEIYIKGPAIVHVDSETTVEVPSAPPRPIRKLPTDNGGRPISKDGNPLPTDSDAKRNSGPKLHWRTWPNEIPKTGVVILLRVELFGIYYYVAGYLDGVDFVDSAGHPVFRDDPDDEDTVFERRTPDEFQWIPLGDLLGDLLKEGK